MEQDGNIKLSEGQIVRWEGSSRTVYGIVKSVNGELQIFVDDVHSFAIKDVQNSMVIVK